MNKMAVCILTYDRDDLITEFLKTQVELYENLKLMCGYMILMKIMYVEKR